MPKLLVINMQDDYPFSLSAFPKTIPPNTPILVRQTFDSQVHEQIAKVTFAKNLRNRSLIKIDSFNQQANSLHVLYEHIESKVNPMNPEIIYRVYESMKNLAAYLSNIGVRINFKEQKIGVDSNYSVKYFMGLDFNWEASEDEQFLPNFYRTQLNRIFESVINNSNNQIVEYGYQNNEPSYETHNRKIVDRKSSFATLPSRFNRLYQIDKKLSNLKSMFGDQRVERSEYDFSPAPVNLLRTHKSQQTNKQIFLKPPPDKKEDVKVMKNNKRFFDRKFSGDAKLSIVSNKKLYEKETDIKSERGFEITTQTRISRRKCEEHCSQEIETVQSKSRIDQMKHQEYLQITKSNKGYLKDFLSVLEDEEKNSSHSLTRKPEHQIFILPQTSESLGKSAEFISKNQEIVPWVSTQNLQRKAKDAISNSLKAIKRFKAFGKTTS